MIITNKRTIVRDISWLSFNARVLQEANDATVPLKERIRFLGIFSNNLDEFFRVRVGALKRMAKLKTSSKKKLEENPQKIIDDIQLSVLQQQAEFDRIWVGIQKELRNEKIFLINEKQLNKEQQKFIQYFFEEEVRSNTIPLMIESIATFPYLREKSIYLGVVLSHKTAAYKQKYALIEIPVSAVGRFVLLPSKPGEQHIILLEDVIRFCLPAIFSYFGFDTYKAHIFKVTKDAEIDIDNDLSTTLIQKIEKGLKDRRKAKAVRFVYDKDMDAGLLAYLIRRLQLSKNDNIIPGGRIHNFRHFMNFPNVFSTKNIRKKPFTHPALETTQRVTDVILEKDVMLHFPYHNFNSLIDLLREAAIDPDVTTIKITCYRLAAKSKIINALINAVRNGKHVVVCIELSARFDEEANLEWKERLELEGVKVLIGIPNMKVHAKICMIKKRVKNYTIHYGFISTGNLNEQTAQVYADHCLLTSDRYVMADINRIFNYLENPNTGTHILKTCKTLLVSPIHMRKHIYTLIQKEIKQAKAKKTASIILKLNSLSDTELIQKLYEAAKAGVHIKLIIRGICCMLTQNKKFHPPIQAISIVDEYLEHARIMVFYNGGKEKYFISSADWMVRNLDHRLEAATPIVDKAIQQELKDILQIQIQDNVKARILDNKLSNQYVQAKNKKKIRSQVETYHYLFKKHAGNSH